MSAALQFCAPAENPFPKEDDEARRHFLSKVIVSGAIGGAVADSSMHIIDTVKTRMQRDGTSGRPPIYNGMLVGLSWAAPNRLKHAIREIHRREGISGLLAGFKAAAIGSILATTVYFTTYESSKRALLDRGINESICYFSAGALGDAAAAVFYVPSEVVKTRMQLQGRYNNPYSVSAHNYRGDWHALSQIWQRAGFRGLFYGWKATLCRDVPFTALQFTIYETLRAMILRIAPRTHPETTHAEWLKKACLYDILPGMIAGVTAGFATTPIDVVKTYIQTQARPPSQKFIDLSAPPLPKPSNAVPYYDGILSAVHGIWRTRGIRGLFSGASPRMVWTGSQSTIMFFCYEWLLGKSWLGVFDG